MEAYAAGTAGRRGPVPHHAHAGPHAEAGWLSTLGIPDYWVIDPEEREAVCWQSKSREPRIESAELTWQPRAELPPLVISLSEILP